MGTARVHIVVRGQVQGVGFRYRARQQAQSLGLTGWVRNCPDGTVEAVAEGDEAGVRQFVEWSRHGPSEAEVSGVDVSWEDACNEPGHFQIRG